MMLSSASPTSSPVKAPLDDAALDQVFRNARTFRRWLPRPVSDELLQQVYELAVLGPTSANSSPMRVVFVKSPEAKEKLKAALDGYNVPKMMGAAVTAIIAHDMEFTEFLPLAWPHEPAQDWYAGKPEKIRHEAERGSSMQGAYFILAARALGLDCGPMGGFSRRKVDEIFFPEGRWKSHFLVNLGYGDPEGLLPRDWRPPFETACRIE